uniref:Transposase n=1 Tax=Steinernema glaseri TaxID=37863 RepID=A0A1I8AFE5_9BILA
MYTDGVMFDDGMDKKTIQAIGEIIMNEQKQMLAQPAPQDTEALKHTILMKEFELLQKQEKLLEKENYKLDLEISKLKSKFNF